MGIFRWDIADVVRDLNTEYSIRQSYGVYVFERQGEKGNATLTYDPANKTVKWTFKNGQNRFDGERKTWTNVGEDVRCVERLLFGHLISLTGEKKQQYHRDQKAA